MCCGSRKKAAASRPLEISLSQNCTRGRKARVERGNLLHFLCPSAEETQLFSSFVKKPHTHTHSHPDVCSTLHVCCDPDRQERANKHPSFSAAGSLRVAMVTGNGKKRVFGRWMLVDVKDTRQINNLNKPYNSLRLGLSGSSEPKWLKEDFVNENTR